MVRKGKKKGSDGKACWEGFYYGGYDEKNEKDICLPNPKKKKTAKYGSIVMKKGGHKTAAWTRKEGKNPTGGLNAKGVASYRAANPGSKLKMAVTGKVKRGSKASKRRKSFCARMKGVKGPMRKNGKPTRKALALRKWKC
tara:strand:+ start:506 stop:925 length:420 start_codon:yes stop_codon:yes gene_type:complete